MVLPYQLPDDYLFFLEYYGGLTIESTTGVVFSAFGVGPEGESPYGNVVSYNLTRRELDFGRLYIGSWEGLACLTEEQSRLVEESKKAGEYNPFDDKYPDHYWFREFHLDLAGIVQEHSIIGPKENTQSAQSTWLKVANSFTEWVEQAAETEGTFGCV